MQLNIPNFLTWLRIVMIPLFVGIFYLPEGLLAPQTTNLVATILFTLAALTDWLDGYLARTLNQTSSFGAFLDPVADKLMVAAALVVLVVSLRSNRCLVRDPDGGGDHRARDRDLRAARMDGERSARSRRVAVSVHSARYKTVAQMVAIPMLLYQHDIGPLDIAYLGNVLMLVAAVLTVVSMVYYLRLALPHLA
jgi:cardiolipin synthase (CMP-forming)